MASISEVAPMSKIVRAETFDWESEMHSITVDVLLLGICLTIYGLMKLRAYNAKRKDISAKESDKTNINHTQGRFTNNSGSISGPAREISSLTGERHKGRVLQLYQHHQFAQDLSTLTQDESYQVFFNICLAAGRSGRMDIIEQVLADMRRIHISCPEELYTMLFKTLAVKRHFKEVLQLAKWMRVDNVSISNCLAYSCLCFSATEEKEWSAALYFFKKLLAVGEPNVKDYGNVMRAYAALGDATGAYELMKTMRERGLEPDAVMFNMAFAISCVAGKHLDLAEEMLRMFKGNAGIVDVITYNTLMKGYVQAGRIREAFDVLKDMETSGSPPSVVTYGTLLDACINVDDMDGASSVFQMIQKSGCEMNNVLCTTLIKGFAKKGQLAKAINVYRSMLEQGVEPDRVMYSTLVKAFCDMKDLEGALKLFHDICEKGVLPDEVLFNTLLNGCANCTNLELGERIFRDMVSQGIKPTVSSISTMVKLYAECQSLPQAVQLLHEMQPRFGVVPEQRLYSQVIHAALRTRRHAAALDMFQAWQHFTTVSDEEIGKLMRACIGFNMLQTAVAFAEHLLEKASLRSEHLQVVVDAAAKKKKEAPLRSALSLAKKYGIQIQHRV
jgi:pentatricopeptide repeat protein